MEKKEEGVPASPASSTLSVFLWRGRWEDLLKNTDYAKSISSQRETEVTEGLQGTAWSEAPLSLTLPPSPATFFVGFIFSPKAQFPAPPQTDHLH